MIDCPRPCHFPCYPCCGVEYRGELSAAACVRMTRDFIYQLTPAKYASHRFMTPLTLSNSTPPTYLPSFSLCLLSVFIFISLFITLIVAYVSNARVNSRIVTNSCKSKERVFQRKIKKNSVISHAILSLCTSLFLFLSFTPVLSVRLRFDLFDL